MQAFSRPVVSALPGTCSSTLCLVFFGRKNSSDPRTSSNPRILKGTYENYCRYLGRKPFDYDSGAPTLTGMTPPPPLPTPPYHFCSNTPRTSINIPKLGWRDPRKGCNSFHLLHPSDYFFTSENCCLLSSNMQKKNTSYQVFAFSK